MKVEWGQKIVFLNITSAESALCLYTHSFELLFCRRHMARLILFMTTKESHEKVALTKKIVSFSETRSFYPESTQLVYSTVK